MPRQLTKRQSEVVSLIKRFIKDVGYPPSTRELADKLGVTPTAIDGHIHALERKGALKRTPGVARGLALAGGRHASS